MMNRRAIPDHRRAFPACRRAGTTWRPRYQHRYTHRRKTTTSPPRQTVHSSTGKMATRQGRTTRQTPRSTQVSNRICGFWFFISAKLRLFPEIYSQRREKWSLTTKPMPFALKRKTRPSAGFRLISGCCYRFRRRFVRDTFLSMRARSSSILTRSWVMVSRSRTVTQPSVTVSWSMVTQNGVPMAS